MAVLSKFLLALVLTILLESLVALALGWRGRRRFLVLALVNLITNPALNYLLYANSLLGIFSPSLGLLLVGEVVVVLLEWRLYVSVLSLPSVSALTAAFLMNLVSFLFGIFFFTTIAPKYY